MSDAAPCHTKAMVGCYESEGESMLEKCLRWCLICVDPLLELAFFVLGDRVAKGGVGVQDILHPTSPLLSIYRS